MSAVHATCQCSNHSDDNSGSVQLYLPASWLAVNENCTIQIGIPRNVPSSAMHVTPEAFSQQRMVPCQQWWWLRGQTPKDNVIR